MRNFFAHKGRMILSAVAVMLSVAFVCGTLVFSDTMSATFDRLFRTTASDVSVAAKEDRNAAQRTARLETVPASLLDTVRDVEGVESAHGAVSTETATLVDGKGRNIGPTGGAPTIVGAWGPSARKQFDVVSGHAPRGPRDLVVDADTAEKKHLETGDRVKVIAVPGTFTARISGIAEFRTTNPGAALAFVDPGTAPQRLLGKGDVYSSLNVTVADGVADKTVKKRVVEAIGHGYQVQTKGESVESAGERIGSFLDFLKYVMLGFAGLSVLVGVFLIVNTFSMLVAQRTREIGLLRAIGADRRQMNRSVLIEALMLGLVGSVLGVGAGIGLAVGLMEFMGTVGMQLDTSQLTVKATTPVAGLALGVVVTVLAAYLPARRASKVSPMAALRDAGMPADRRAGRVRALIGLILVAAGGAALAATVQAGKVSEGWGYLVAGIVLTLIGFVVVGPSLAGLVVRLLGAVVLRVFGPVGRMAERNTLRNPRRTGATAAALMIGLALVAGLSVVGSSLVASVGDELDRSVGADFVVRSDKPVPEAERAVESVPSLKHVTDMKMVNVKLTAPDGRSETTALTATDPTYTEDVRQKTLSGSLSAAYGPDAMSVRKSYAVQHGISVGDRMTVEFSGGRTVKLKVAAITADDSSMGTGATYVAISTVERYVPEGKLPPNVITFAKAKDGEADAAYAAVKRKLEQYPQYMVRNQADYKEELQDQIGQLLNMVYGLLGLAIVVAVLGVVNTLALSVVERTREIGLLRAIGLSRRQLRRMIRLEAVVIALFGALLGLGLGMGWGATAQDLLALEGVRVLDIPWPTIVWVFCGSAFVGLVAALVPAFRAGRMNVLAAIATE